MSEKYLGKSCKETFSKCPFDGKSLWQIFKSMSLKPGGAKLLRSNFYGAQRLKSGPSRWRRHKRWPEPCQRWICKLRRQILAKSLGGSPRRDKLSCVLWNVFFFVCLRYRVWLPESKTSLVKTTEVVSAPGDPVSCRSFSNPVGDRAGTYGTFL